MEKGSTPPARSHSSSTREDRDIATQPYEGPSPIAAAAGEGAVAHFQYAAIGLLAGSGISAIFTESTHKMVEKMRAYATKHEDKFLGKSVFALFGHGDGTQKTLEHLEQSLAVGSSERKAMDKLIRTRELGFGYSLLDHTVGAVGGRNMMHRLLEKGGERAATAVTIGGILGAVGFFVTPLLFAHRGMKRAWRGEDQLTEAQQEILAQRHAYEDLQDRYLEIRTELDDYQRKQASGASRIRREEVEPIEVQHSEAEAPKDKQPPEAPVAKHHEQHPQHPHAHIHAASHEGHVHAHKQHEHGMQPA